jgi:hypothetical protein
MPLSDVSALLEAASSAEAAHATSRQISTLKGIRGVPSGELAKLAAKIWAKDRPKLPADEEALGDLFGSAWEDGLVAIGLLAAIAPDAPADALEVGLHWLERIDDLATADALGWLVLGPAAIASQEGASPLVDLRTSVHPAIRRAAVMAGMAFTTAFIEGPAAAPLREKLGTRDVRFVAEPLSASLAELGDAFIRDEDPQVRKALRRVLAAWALGDPDAALGWLAGVKGGVPKMIREEIEKAAKKGKRRSA